MKQMTDTEYRKKISELELELKVERMKYCIVADYSSCGLWEYDIANKKLIQSKKLDGKWNESNLEIENYRDTVKSWGLIHPEDISVFDAYCDSMDRGDKTFQYDLRAVSDDSRFIWLRYIGAAVVDENQVPIKIVGKTLDVTKEKDDRAALIKRASQDPLTHLYNKSATRDYLEQVMSENDTGNQSGLLMIVDIDNFKTINDRWGHLYGDSVIERFSAMLLAFFQPGDIVGRIGGDEFLIYCQDISKTRDAEHMADRINWRSREVDLKDNEILTVSIGMALYPRDAKSYDALFRSADIALYQAKRRGKNTYALYNKYEKNAVLIGETDRKRSYETEAAALPKDMVNIEKELFDYSFETMCINHNFLDALLAIFTEIGIYFDLDRIYVVEYNYSTSKSRLLQEWQREKMEPSMEAAEQYFTDHWDMIERRYYEDNLHNFGMEESILHSQLHEEDIMDEKVQSRYWFPIFDGSQLVGIASFEDCTKKREWTTTESATLSSITKMISSYMLRLHTKAELEEEILYTGSAMDSQKLTYYAVDSKNYEIVYISRYANELFPNIKVGEPCYRAIMGYTEPCQNCPIRGLNEERSQYAAEVYSEKYDSWFTVGASTICPPHKEPQYLLCWTDVTTFLERVKSTDQLTQTLSYDKFRADALKHLSMKKGGYAIAFLGIRDFAHINEEYGYTTGDIVLQTVAKHFTDALYSDELICRIKGDDFIMLLEDDDIVELKYRMHRICVALGLFLHDRFQNMSVDCICGIYGIKETDYSISTILDKANLARKFAARYYPDDHSIFVMTDEHERQEAEDKHLERTMIEALRKNEFCVYLQPKVNLATGEIAGAEALVRWADECGRLVSPGRFIPLAEKNGFVVEIDKFVYESLFRQISIWLQMGKKVPVISFNVSRLHLFNDDFLNYMRMMVEKYRIPYEILEIEITESVFFDNIDRLIEMISRLRNMGFAISMDDFGTGYSTLSLMKSLPIDIIKIDGKFFYKNHLDQKSKAIVSSIIHLAKNLELGIVAEGIELQDQVDYIISEQCDYAQGYYYYKPMPMEEFETLL